MLLATSYIVTWFSFLMSFAAAAVVIMVLGVFTWGGNNSLNIESWRWRPLLAVYIISMFGAQVGFAAAEASQHNSGVSDARFQRQATHDLRLEGFRRFSVDPYGRTVTITIGSFGCPFNFDLDQIGAKVNHRVLWRPVLQGLSIGVKDVPDGIPSEAFFTPANFKSLQLACRP